jgi:phosphate transport system permease protein
MREMTRRISGGGWEPPAPSGMTKPVGERKKRVHNIGDFVFRNTTKIFAFFVFSLVFIMAYEMYRGSTLSIAKFGWSFLVSETWDPVTDKFGALPFIYGTVISSLLALIIALPLSLGVAMFLSELCPRWLEQPLSFLVELLAAIPSIVYGLWGIFVLVPWLRITVQPFLRKYLGTLPLFQGPAYGFSMLAAGLVLSIMILPIITSISRDVMKAVPRLQREAALGLGATRWETTRVVLQSAKSGILGATLLGLGRAVGETMAVTMVIGNRPEIVASLFGPAYSMASVLANEFAEATTDIYTIVLNAFARLIVWSTTKRFKTT